MKKVLILLAAILLAGSVTSADAATACFDWACNSSTGVCGFDATCSSASPFIWKYDFAYGDGSGTGLTGNKIQSHSYASDVYEASVTLRILYWSDPGINTVTCTINTRLVPVGPQLPPNFFYGRCTE